jgi:hypothetical protein
MRIETEKKMPKLERRGELGPKPLHLRISEPVRPPSNTRSRLKDLAGLDVVGTCMSEDTTASPQPPPVIRF